MRTSQFRALWRELHLHSVSLKIVDPVSERAWLNRFAIRIRCRRCRKHWREVLEKLPPKLDGTSRSYFAWTVHAHNEINRMLGKKIITLREARHLHLKLET